MRLALVLSLALLFPAQATSSTNAERTKLVKKIDRIIAKTQPRQEIMGVKVTPTWRLYRHRKLWRVRQAYRWWSAKGRLSWQQFTHPPHKSGWLCIHRYEGAWTDANDPYWGGLQMDRGFMSTYAPALLLRRGYANRWSPLQQMWVAERAHRSGRGYYPWPNTARYCGLL